MGKEIRAQSNIALRITWLTFFTHTTTLYRKPSRSAAGVGRRSLSDLGSAVSTGPASSIGFAKQPRGANHTSRGALQLDSTAYTLFRVCSFDSNANSKTACSRERLKKSEAQVMSRGTAPTCQVSASS